MPSTSTTTPNSRTLAPGAAALPAMIGKYRVLKLIGEGATSEVFLCHDDFQDRDVAIKRVRPMAAADTMDGRFSERFYAAEAALVGRGERPERMVGERYGAPPSGEHEPGHYRSGDRHERHPSAAPFRAFR